MQAAKRFRTLALGRAKKCLLLGIKRGPLGLHVGNELSDSFGCLLVSYAQQKASVVLDLLVEFGALVTHSHFPVRAEPALFA